jgi:cytochrome c-type biogenesis protein
MEYLISLLEGIITFISPCMLPMLPIFISYFAGQESSVPNRSVIKNALGFVIGFSIVFVTLGAFAGTLGSLLKEYSAVVNLIAGVIVIVFGLNFLGIIKLSFINKQRHVGTKTIKAGFLSSATFGLVFSVSWTPCVSTFLGSALMLAASSGDSMKGILMLTCFSLGLGIPFIISAILIDQLKTTFEFIKKNYRIINIISGGLLVAVGLLMATGVMGYYLSILTF